MSSKRELFEKIETFVEEHDGWSEFGYSGKDGIEIPGVGFAKIVEDFGGGEGSGEERWIVFTLNGKHYRKNGYYVSFDGSHFDGALEEVEPFEKSVTFYRKV